MPGSHCRRNATSASESLRSTAMMKVATCEPPVTLCRPTSVARRPVKVMLFMWVVPSRGKMVQVESTGSIPVGGTTHNIPAYWLINIAPLPPILTPKMLLYPYAYPYRDVLQWYSVDETGLLSPGMAPTTVARGSTIRRRLGPA